MEQEFTRFHAQAREGFVRGDIQTIIAGKVGRRQDRHAFGIFPRKRLDCRTANVALSGEDPSGMT